MFVIGTTKVVEVFCYVDDFSKGVDPFYVSNPLRADLQPVSIRDRHHLKRTQN